MSLLNRGDKKKKNYLSAGCIRERILSASHENRKTTTAAAADRFATAVWIFGISDRRLVVVVGDDQIG